MGNGGDEVIGPVHKTGGVGSVRRVHHVGMVGPWAPSPAAAQVVWELRHRPQRRVSERERESVCIYIDATSRGIFVFLRFWLWLYIEAIRVRTCSEKGEYKRT